MSDINRGGLMNPETKLNVVWVAVLVPIILAVFGAVSATMIPEFGKMLRTLALRLFLTLFFVSIPLLVSKWIKNQTRGGSDSI